MTTEALPMPLAPTVDEAYRFFREIAHRYGANFSVGFRFLPRRKRLAVYAAYAWCRWADDIADEETSPESCVLSPESNLTQDSELRTQDYPHRMASLDSWQRELDAC